MNRLSHGELVQLAEEGRRKKMDELISRQAAIDAVPQRIKGLGGESWMKTYRRSGYNDCVDACLDAIRHLPSAQPERKKGKWICHDEREGYLIAKYSCSVCDYYSGTKRTNFCPNCGADMREEKTDD